ncbi:MAG: hypothetical protein ACFFAY_12440 [Promethearchaeota archaeon]
MGDSEEDSEHFVSLFAPILHFHPNEGSYCCFPSDAESIFEQYANDWIKFKGEMVPKELDPLTPCYYEVWHEPHMIQMKFWFWYNYNRFPRTIFGRGRHIGDWEHVEVRHYPLDSETPGTIWLLSNHLQAELVSYPGFFTVPGFTQKPITLTDNHVHVWVALGSHANYASPHGKKKRFMGLWKDMTEEGGLTWHTKDSLKSLDDTNFAHYEGRWGNEKSPRSPRNPYNSRTRNAPLVRPVRTLCSLPL